MHATMQDVPLTLTAILAGIDGTFGESTVTTYTGPDEEPQTATYSDVSARAAQLANGLARLGIARGERVATFMWNTQEHLEAYLAVPCSGAVLHTLNIRLTPQQLGFIATHADDKIVIVDSSLIDTLKSALALMPTIGTVIVAGPSTDSDLADLSGLVPDVIRYDDLLSSQPSSIQWPTVDEHSAAAICYTSGTTGEPKGVVYSHRSLYLHALSACTANILGISCHDRVLPMVPMFHVNAWGIPYASLMAGAALVLPGPHLKPAALVDMISAYRVTVSAGVPTVLNDTLQWLRINPGLTIDSLRRVLCGGPRHRSP